MHGGDSLSYKTEYGRLPLDFSANVSPLAMPDGMREAAERALSECGSYPDPLCRELRCTLSDRLSVPPEYILCGNGASDLIYRFVYAVKPREVLVTAPAFSEYEAASAQVGAHIRRFPLDEKNDFHMTEDFLEQIKEDTDIVFLCQPNNPTGVAIPLPLLAKILVRCRETGTRLLVDECFTDFLDRPEDLTLLPNINEKQLIILKAFTKFYPMAGMRLGYTICSDTLLLQKMAAAGPPWAVSSITQTVGTAALSETAYEDKLKDMIKKERVSMINALKNLGIKVIPGEANFLLFKAVPLLGEALKKKGLLIRECGDFIGLGPEWYRIAVRTEEENALLVNALREVVS